MWKVGIVGTGYWSEKHLKAWSRIPQVKITALCNRSPEKMQVKAKEYNISEDRLYTSIDEMLAKADIDFVDIITGPETHLPLVKLAAAAGKHVMCQKPFAPSLEEAEEIVNVAKRAGIRLMVTENWRWLEPYQMIKNMLNEGRLGKIYNVKYTHFDYFTFQMTPGNEAGQSFLRDMPRLIFYEMGVHWYDTWRFLFGEPRRLYAEIKRVSPYVKGEDCGIVTLGHDDFYGHMDMSWASRRNLTAPAEDKTNVGHTEHLVIEGDKATLILYTKGGMKIITDEGTVTQFDVNDGLGTPDQEESHYRLQSHFIYCLDSGESFQTSGEDNLQTLRLTFATYESAASHAVVQFN